MIFHRFQSLPAKINDVLYYVFYVCCVCFGINCLMYAFPEINISFYSKIHANTVYPQTNETKREKTADISTRKSEYAQLPCPWPPNQLNGRQALDRTPLSFEELKQAFTFMEYGHFRPACKPYQKVAIIVPYRNRKNQLKVFLNNVIPRIHQQGQEFGIYLVEQADHLPFNRGVLSNIGFQQALQEYHYDCIIIHDVDIIPEDDRNFYYCDEDHPYHLAGKVEKFNYSVPYLSYFGGISSLTRKQYMTVNGFSNLFFGWGGEDDDFLRRIRYAGFTFKRPNEAFSHCGSVEHEQAPRPESRFTVLSKTKSLWKKEGLNTLDYKLLRKEKKKLFVWIYVSISTDVRAKAGVNVPIENPEQKSSRTESQNLQ